MEKEDVYRPWLLSVWFAMEPGSILQPPTDQKGIRSIDFPIHDLDYTPILDQPEIKEISENNTILFEESVYKPTIKTNQTVETDKYDQKVEKRQRNQTEKTAPIASYVMVESNDLLNVNVTPSAYHVIMYLAQITAGSSKKEFLENKVKPPLKFLNFLGEKCDLYLANETLVEKENAVGFNLIFEDYSIDGNLLFCNCEYRVMLIKF